MVSHTGTILGTSATDQDDTVLLNVVALTRNVGSDDGAGRELDTGSLSLAGVGLLGSHDTNSQAHALERRAVGVGQGGRNGVARALALSDTAQHLVQGCGAGGRGAEGAERGEGGSGDSGHRGRRGCCGGENWAPGRRGEELAEDGADHGGQSGSGEVGRVGLDGCVRRLGGAWPISKSLSRSY